MPRTRSSEPGDICAPQFSRDLRRTFGRRVTVVPADDVDTSRTLRRVRIIVRGDGGEVEVGGCAGGRALSGDDSPVRFGTVAASLLLLLLLPPPPERSLARWTERRV